MCPPPACHHSLGLARPCPWGSQSASWEEGSPASNSPPEKGLRPATQRTSLLHKCQMPELFAGKAPNIGGPSLPARHPAEPRQGLYPWQEHQPWLMVALLLTPTLQMGPTCRWTQARAQACGFGAGLLTCPPSYGSCGLRVSVCTFVHVCIAGVMSVCVPVIRIPLPVELKALL